MHLNFAILCMSILASIVHGQYEDWPPALAKLVEDKELLEWVPPAEINKHYSYYLSGYDYEDKPVWVLEWGRWNIRKIVEGGYNKDFVKFNNQMYANMARSLVNATTEGEPVTNSMTVIIDMEGFKADQITSPPTLAYILGMFREFLPILSHVGEKTFIINAHFVIENLIGLLRPILGDVLEEVKIFGTNRSKWQPVLIKEVPPKSLPEWYGGSVTFKPVKVFG